MDRAEDAAAAVGLRWMDRAEDAAAAVGLKARWIGPRMQQQQ